MSDKEQIECKYKFQKADKFDNRPYCTCFCELCEDIPFVCDENCQIYEDFKQLTRKTQECEELKNQIKTLSVQKELYDSYCRTHCGANSIAIDLCTEFDFIEHQQITSIIEEGIRILRFQRDQYKQALEEIEVAIKNLKQDMCNNCSYLLGILDIITKAKGIEE